jgi:hypothetical protein
MDAASKLDLTHRPLICAQLNRNHGRVVQDQVCVESPRGRLLPDFRRPTGFVLGMTLAVLVFTLRNAVGW